MSDYQLPEFEREWIEFLNEIRTALPGVQVLFGFLLVVPFNPGFRGLSEEIRLVYLVCFVTTAAASAFLIAPAVYHRLHWRREIHDKDQMMRSCNRLAIVGTLLLAVAMTTAVFCVSSLVAPGAAAVTITAGAGVLFFWLWFGLPLTRRRRERSRA